MFTAEQKKILVGLIIKHKPDHVRMKYYPITETVSTHVTEINTVCKKSQKKKLLDYVKDSGNLVSGTYTEISIKDTFMRSFDTDVPTMYFRRRTFMFESQKVSGKFTIELYNMCTEFDFPYIVDYHHKTVCKADTYDLEHVRICFSDTGKSTYVDVNFDIDTENVNQSIDLFAEQIDMLKKKKIL